MAKYRYDGPDPVPDGEGGIVRPGEVREFTKLPDYGPWTELLSGEPGPPAAPPPAPPPPAAPAPAKGASATTSAPGGN